MISKITNFPIPKKEQITKRSIHKIRVAYGKADRASTALRRFKPESSHAIKSAISHALRCKKNMKKETIVFNLSGHGLLDLKFYEGVT